MSKHDCKSHRAEIEEAAAGGQTRSPALSAHLAACAPCEHSRREGESLRRLVGGLEKVSAPADFEFRLRARMAAAGGARRRQPFRLGFVPGVVSVALAACFVILSASIYLRRETVPNRPAESSGETASAPVTPPASVENGAPASPNVEVKNVGEPGGEIASVPRDKTAGVPRQGGKIRQASDKRARLTRKGGARAETGEGNVASFNLQPAPILNAASPTAGEQASTSTEAATIAVRTPAVPLRVVLRDERGAARVVSLNSVSFGAQELVRQGRDVVPVSYTDKKGVW